MDLHIDFSNSTTPLELIAMFKIVEEKNPFLAGYIYCLMKKEYEQVTSSKSKESIISNE